MLVLLLLLVDVSMGPVVALEGLAIAVMVMDEAKSTTCKAVCVDSQQFKNAPQSTETDEGESLVSAVAGAADDGVPVCDLENRIMIDGGDN